METTLISAEWLLANQNQVIILDATYFLPTMGRDGRSEFEIEHIPDARFFDIDGIRDETNPLPHMLPDAPTFERAMRALGINNDSQIVVYDNSPFLSSARAWWMLRYFGHRAVCVLDGGLNAYKQAGGRVGSGKTDIQPGNFQARPAFNCDVILFDALREKIEQNTAEQIIDARASDRFKGLAPEPRQGLRSGHMPNALNLPIGAILDTDTGKMKSAEALKQLFLAAGMDFSKPAITTCGSGVTAAGLTLALAILGKTDIRLYDGSWSEWGASDAPIETD